MNNHVVDGNWWQRATASNSHLINDKWIYFDSITTSNCLENFRLSKSDNCEQFEKPHYHCSRQYQFKWRRPFVIRIGQSSLGRVHARHRLLVSLVISYLQRMYKYNQGTVRLALGYQFVLTEIYR